VTLDLISRQFFGHGPDRPAARERALLELLFTRAGKVVSKEPSCNR
jgi:DNA-binding response OmpR family regulator